MRQLRLIIRKSKSTSCFEIKLRNIVPPQEKEEEGKTIVELVLERMMWYYGNNLTTRE